MAVVGDILLFLLLFFTIMLGGSVLIYWSYRQARKKGYRPPAAALILLVGISAGIAATVALHPENTTSIPLFLWRFFWVPTLLSGAALALLVFILPRRTVRVFGERKSHFPFRGLGRVLKVLAVIVVVLVGFAWLSRAAKPSTFFQTVAFAVALWAAGRFLVREAQTQHVPPLDEVFKADQRAPVLYLRAFNQESQFFIIGTKAEYGKWAKSFHAAIARADQKIGLTLEEYLAEDLNHSIGPFVALGSPEDYLAPPGALRVYAKDDEWKARFDELARQAACVIVEVSKSDNLRWEFEHLRGEGLQEKLFVLTRPSTEGSRIAWKYWGMLWRVKGIRTMMWPEFSSDLQKLGYSIKFSDPGAGAVLAFDAQGEGFVLTAGGNWPQDFVDPIRAWICERKKVGCCIDSKCVKCGREVYALATETETLCIDCRAGATSTKRAWIRLGGLLSGVLLIAVPLVLTVLVALVLPDAWVDRWIGWIFTIFLILSVVVATYWSGKRKRRSES